MKNELDKLYLPGEREARNGTEMKIFTLKPERGFENDANQIHFRYLNLFFPPSLYVSGLPLVTITITIRTAESQFYRLCETMTGVKVHIRHSSHFFFPV